MGSFTEKAFRWGFEARAQGYKVSHHPPISMHFRAPHLRAWREGWHDADRLAWTQGKGEVIRMAESGDKDPGEGRGMLVNLSRDDLDRLHGLAQNAESEWRRRWQNQGEADFAQDQMEAYGDLASRLYAKLYEKGSPDE